MRILGKQGCFLGIACFMIGLFAPPVSAAKHVILMISDGQGMGTVMATDFYNGNRAVYESFEDKYAMTTYSALGAYKPDLGWRLFGSHLLNPTDSAAAATAMATAVKTYPGMLGKSPLFIDVKNIVETASTQGLATGVVTSVEVSHATPAGMVAHNISRNNYEEIAAQMIYGSELDVIMGAGHPMYDNNGHLKSHDRDYAYVGGEAVFADLTDADGARAKDGRSWAFMDEKADFEALAQGSLSAGKVFGLARAATTLQQGRSGDPQVVDQSNRNPSVPSLSDMALGALHALSNDPDGFFLMVEGGAVDWANHSNEKGRMIEEQTAFNAAVSEVVAWVEENSNWDETLLIVTADHECGYLWGADERAFVPVGDNGAGNLPSMVFHADTHSNVPVPCYVKGSGAGPFLDGLVDGTDTFFSELFSGFDPGFSGDFIDNTDLFLLMSRWLEGEDEGSNGSGQWLKGDLHAHSLHSDGNAPVAAVLKSAEDKDLDFFVLTEHDSNMFDPQDPGPVMPTHWEDPDYTSEETVLLYGVEWTTGKGHANAWAAAPFDYTPLWHANTGLDAVAAVYGAHDGEALFSINHPSAIFCCPWEYDVDNAVDTIEIWNSMYRIPNLNGWSSHPFWDAELLKGRRMTGVGGSDTHKLVEYASDPFAKIEAALFGHGNPTTWVYAQEKTGDAILRSLKNGRVSLSYAPDAERLDLVADRDGDGYFETLMGDNLIQTPGRELSFQIDIRNPAPPGWFAVPRVKELTAENLVKLVAGEVDLPSLLGLLAGKDTYLVGVLKNGIPHRAWIVSGGATRVTFTDTPASRGRTYYRAELMGTPDLLLFQRLLYGRVKAVTNPIYVNFPAR
ncbi:alkaline phosphatase [Desulfoluna butyratoxydans]|uniref:Alkaline phosphatase n=1 Tax=Desulfoluna butyratoxydans TaxID=231438 RepID=A0A4U8YPU1_9BACT|nr:alkaline phosphatase [Desulfoluna butyratoxydans]VFQ45457.1 alkaline phosphatase [Desulfoluna butyratoxydans]